MDELPGCVFLLLPPEGRLDVDLDCACFEDSSVYLEEDLEEDSAMPLEVCWLGGETHPLLDMTAWSLADFLRLERVEGREDVDCG